MARKQKEKCKFEHCENDMVYPTLEVCSTCYSGLRTWVGRSLADQTHRMSQYHRLVERMEYVLQPQGGRLPGYRKRELEEKRKQRAKKARRRKLK